VPVCPPNDSVREQFRAQALTYAFDANAYLDALHEVPVIPENRLHNILTYHSHLAALIVEIRLERLQNHQTAETLQEKTRHLDRANQALNSLLDHRQTEKRAVEENIYANIRKHVLPYVDKLAAGQLHPEARTHLDIIRTNLRERISPASDSLCARYIELTPTELRVADLVRQGKPTKEIAALLKVAPSSVAAYRNSLRRKLGLVNSRTNLRVFLNSFRA
jgi:DNA-binding CsgD family transcriptional regulator